MTGHHMSVTELLVPSKREAAEMSSPSADPVLPPPSAVMMKARVMINTIQGTELLTQANEAGAILPRKYSRLASPKVSSNAKKNLLLLVITSMPIRAKQNRSKVGQNLAEKKECESLVSNCCLPMLQQEGK